MNLRKGRPISPDQLTDAKSAAFPPEVFDAFNELICENMDGAEATIKQDDVVRRIIGKLGADAPQYTRQQIFDRGWLNVEDAYRKAGWSVEYDKPGFNETYPATFTFKKGRKRR